MYIATRNEHKNDKRYNNIIIKPPGRGVCILSSFTGRWANNSIYFWCRVRA